MGEFWVPLDVLQVYKESMLRSKSAFDRWAAMAEGYAKEYPAEHTEFQRITATKKLQGEVSALFEEWENNVFSGLDKFEKAELRFEFFGFGYGGKLWGRIKSCKI